MALRAMLEAYQPSDALEAQHRDAMLSLCQSSGHPLARTHFEPGHFTASAFVVDPSRRSRWLIHHRKLKRWLQPGGHIDDSDGDLCAGARRELEEETGLSKTVQLGAILDLDVHRIPALKGEPAHRHFDVRFAFRAQALEIAPNNETLGARWLPLSEINAVASDESVLRAVTKLRKRL